MSKYIDAEKLIAEIERRKIILDKYEDSFETAACCKQELVWMKDFIDSLQQEQPSLPSNLDEAAMEIVIKMHPCLKDCTILGDRLTRGELMVLVKACAEWMRNQMPMPEDTVIFQKGVAEGRRLEREDNNKALAEMYGYEGGTESPLVKITFTIPKEQVKNLMPIKQGDVFGIENLTNKEGRR